MEPQIQTLSASSQSGALALGGIKGGSTKKNEKMNAFRQKLQTRNFKWRSFI